MPVPADDIGRALSAAIGAERLRIVAGLIRSTGDWDLAEDALSDAVERAMLRWPTDGIPDNPAAWLTTAAHRRAVDVLRRRRLEMTRLQEVTPVLDAPDPYGELFRDDRLRLIFTCCHPALPLAGRVALTLKTVAGLSTRDIARTFLVSEATMGQRLLRTKTKIAHAGISFRVPSRDRLPERTSGVLAVLYLAFTAGYAGGSVEVAGEAVRLAALLVDLLPADAEVAGLAALLMFQHARRDARVDADGDLSPMEEQDRDKWDRPMIAAAQACLADPAPRGPYRLQAEIAAVHATAASAAATNWATIVARYDELSALDPSPVIALNRAVAVGFRDGPAAGLAALGPLNSDDRLAGYHLLPAARAEFLRRDGRGADADVAYRRAIELAGTEADRRFLQRRLRELRADR